MVCQPASQPEVNSVISTESAPAVNLAHLLSGKFEKRRGSVDLPSQSSRESNSLHHSLSEPDLSLPSTMTDITEISDTKKLLNDIFAKLQCLDDIKKDVSELTEVKTSLVRMNETMENIYIKTNENSKSITELEKSLQQTDIKIAQQDIKIAKLNELVGSVSNSSDRALLRPDWSRELVVTGLDSEAVINPFEFLRRLAQILQVNFFDQLIDDVIPLPVVKDKDRVLIVKFTSKLYRDRWLQAKKGKRDILLSSIIPTTKKNTQIYINERSTAVERKRFSRAKEYARSVGYKFCWMRSGRIYLRSNENSKTVRFGDDMLSQSAPLVNDGLSATGIVRSNVRSDVVDHDIDPQLRFPQFPLSQQQLTENINSQVISQPVTDDQTSSMVLESPVNSTSYVQHVSTFSTREDLAHTPVHSITPLLNNEPQPWSQPQSQSQPQPRSQPQQ